MTAGRIKTLFDSYGADRRRWPADAPAGQDAPAQREAAAIDALLDASPTPQVSMVLRDRVLAQAMAACEGAGRARRFVIGRLALISGAGWAAAACAGVVCGVALGAQLNANAQAEAVLYQASLSALDDTEVLG